LRPRITLRGTAKKSSFDEPAQLEDAFFADTTRALVKVAFIISNRPNAPYRAYGLSLAEADVLVTVPRAKNGQLTCSEIAEKTLITKGGITKVLDRLEAKGLVKRVLSRDDRRIISIELSAKGVQFWRKFSPEVARGAREVFEGAFGREEMKRFAKLLALLLSSLETESRETSRRLKQVDGEDWADCK
jgi:DNA-binding MarR family transcriptional regulator